MFSRIHTASLVLGVIGALSPLTCALAGPVNINTADAATLARELKGVGMKRAQAIIDYRDKHGAFRSADELALVKGIGAKAIEANRADIRVDGRATPATPAARPPVKPPVVSQNSPKDK
jgi:competence protein ComEA